MSLIKNVADMAAEMAALDGTTVKAMEDAMGLEYEDRVAAVAGAVSLTPGVGGQSWADIRYRWMAREQALTLVFDTNLSAGTTVTLPFRGTVNVLVWWGDGTFDTHTSGSNLTHTYATEGVYQVTITGSMTQFGDQNAYDAKLVACQSFGIIGLTGLTNLNSGLRNAGSLTVAPQILPTAVTNLQATFAGSFTFNGPQIVGWDTTNVTDMSFLFFNATAFNQNIGGWNTANVTTMSNMLHGPTSFNQDIGGWNVAKVTTMASFIRGNTAFNQDIGSWDVRRITTIDNGLRSTAFNQNLGAWRPSRCTNFANTFFGVTLSTVNYDALLTGWTDFTGTGWDSGSITAFADFGGGQVTVTTSAPHGYGNNHVMRITGTSDYDGSYVISNVTSTTFRITATFVATETGTWNATLQSGVTFTGLSSQYSVGAPTTARGVLTGAPYNWTITDGGQA